MLRFAFKPRHPVTRVAFTADGREVITAQPFTGIAVRDRLTGVARVTHELPRAPVISRLEVHPSLGVIVVNGHTPQLLDLTELRTRTLWELQDDQSPLISQILGPHDMWWRGAADGDLVSLRIRQRHGPLVARKSSAAAINSPLRQPRLTSLQPTVLQFSPDGTKLALGNGDTLGVFDLALLDQAGIGGRQPPIIAPLFTLERPDPTTHGTFADKQAEHWLPPVAFDHAGRSMFTLGLRNRVQRIDLATGGLMAEWGWRCEPIRSLAVSPDDLTAAAGCQRGELVLWDLE